MCAGITTYSPLRRQRIGKGKEVGIVGLGGLGHMGTKFARAFGAQVVLFGDVWARPGLSPRDRSLVTASALIALNRPDQLRFHLAKARENGVTQDELIETITQLAFYAGWPNAVTAIAVAKEVFQRN